MDLRLAFRYFQDLPDKWLDWRFNRSLRSGPLYFFMHIPKTAGTSMRMMLWNAIPKEFVLPNRQDLIANRHKYPPLGILEKQPERLKKARLFAGHYHYGSERIFPQEQIIRMTFMRDPVERSLSLLKHYKARDPKLEDVPFEEILTERKTGFRNGQMVYFTGPMPKATPEERLARAKQVLDSFDFVGISERFEESLLLLNQQIPIQLGPPLNLNKSKSDTLEELDAFRPRLAEWNKLDTQLYDYAKQRLESALNTNKNIEI